MPQPRGSAVIPHLAREQANAVQLYLQYKGYHWNVAGPWFRDLHLLFDEHAATVLETVDTLAERQRMLGAAAAYTLAEMRAASTLPREESLPPTTGEMLRRLLRAHRTVIDGMHQGFRAAEQEGDPGTADIFARYVQAHQKMEWFLRELARETPAPPDEPGRLLVPSEPTGILPKAPGGHTPSGIPGRPAKG